MKNYYQFLNEQMKEKNIKPTRKDLGIGKMIKTIGVYDNLDLSDQLGIIIQMGEYGNLLVQFLAKFSPRLHAGHKNIGEAGRCFYLPLDNVFEVMSDEMATKIKNKDVIQYRASKDLLRIFHRMKFEPKEEYLDVSFFDIDKNNMEVLTYLPAKKFEGDPDVQKGRQAMKLGRVLRKLDHKLTDPQIEELVVQYRAAFKIVVLGEGKNLDVVTGEDIRYWYSNEHYAKPVGGSLWSSCMSSPSCSRYFDLYVENPDKIALAIYTNEDDLLMARALVWRLDDGRIYMDRIYSRTEADGRLLAEYAKKNNMLMYGHNPPRMEVTLPKDYGGKDRPAGGNPYLDTMRNFRNAGKRHYVSNG